MKYKNLFRLGLKFGGGGPPTLPYYILCLVIFEYWKTWLKLVMLENLQACFILFFGGSFGPTLWKPVRLKENRCSSLKLVCWNLKFQDFLHAARWAYFENLVTKILYIVFFAFPPTLNHSEFPCFSFLVLWQISMWTLRK